MQLVDERAVQVAAVQCLGDAADDFEVRPRAFVDDAIGESLDVRRERWRLLRELPHGVEDVARLILCRRRADDLRAALAVEARQIDADAAEERALAVLARQLDIHRAHDAHVLADVVVEAHPAEDGRDDVRDFPRREDQRTACPLALCVREFAHAVQHAIDTISVEACARDLRLGRLQPGRARRQCDAS
jgi:hypothetical protein